MKKKCGKCNNEFTCNRDSILDCHCIHVPISKKAKTYINKKFNDCLCNVCLKQIADMFKNEDITTSSPITKQKN